MGVLKQVEIEYVYHYAPLHYLPFISRAGMLSSKPSLLAAGFSQTHLRSKSRGQDIARGFGGYTHLTLDEHPNILKAKLGAGFPHVKFIIPVDDVEKCAFSLCRYNVAMTRYLRKNGVGGFQESPTNGRYYDGHQIPVARADEDKLAMLEKHMNAGTMIEVLIHGDLPLSEGVTVTCFSPEDARASSEILEKVGVAWAVALVESQTDYPRSEKYVRNVERFVERALADQDWRGDGLEFDRV